MPKSDTESETQPQRHETSDPVLLMLGIGRQLWRREPGDSFVERLRSEDAPLPLEGRLDAPAQGAGIWFFREGRRINRKLTRTQVEVAIGRCPLTTTTVTVRPSRRN